MATACAAMLSIATCPPNSTATLAGTQAAFAVHIQGIFSQNGTMLMDDYAEDAVVEQYDGCTGVKTRFEGKAEIGQFFAAYFQQFNYWIAAMQTDPSTLPFPSIEYTAEQVLLLWVAPTAGVESEYDTFIYDAAFKISRQNTAIQWRCPLNMPPTALPPSASSSSKLSTSAALISGWVLFGTSLGVIGFLLCLNYRTAASKSLLTSRALEVQQMTGPL